jgi:ribosomal protein L11 methyltransferase
MTGAAAGEPRYPYLVVDVPPHEAEEAGANLFELGALGVEERDATTLVKADGDRGARGRGHTTLVASFESDAAARAALEEVPAEWSPRIREVVGDAWRDEWKKHFEPFRLCGSLVVRPPWRAYEPVGTETVIVLEPGRAFGTGLHETTRLVAETLADLGDRLRGAPVLDVGCGSGILSFAALALGAGSVRAIDVDPDAVAVTRENAERNGFAERVNADVAPAEGVAGHFPFVLANIEATPLIALAPALVRLTAPGGVLVLSGILAPDAASDVAPGQWPGVERAYGALRVEEVRRKGEWIAAVLRA